MLTSVVSNGTLNSVYSLFNKNCISVMYDVYSPLKQRNTADKKTRKYTKYKHTYTPHTSY